jgi:hypothetical protein
MSAIYYFAAWTDSGCLCSCSHEHQTVGEAVACISCAGSYVIAVQTGVLRALTPEEEAQSQHASSSPRAVKSAVDPIRVAEEQYRNDGARYAVMTRIKVKDHYVWTTRMTYGTYGEAAAHAGTTDRIVIFGSPVWVALKRYSEPVQKDEEPKDFQRLASATNSRRRAGETLIEYVSRFLEGYGVGRLAEKGNDGHSQVTQKPLPAQDSDFVDFVLSWLNEWDTKELERMYALQVSARLETLRQRARSALRDQARTKTT